MLVLTSLDNEPAVARLGEPAGGHGRIGGAFLTGVHAKPTEGADFEAGVSIDQIAARHLGQQTQLASLELGLETTGIAGACDVGYSCAYVNTLCWRAATTPLPMENNPRAVFERLFGDSDSTEPAARQARMAQRRSILDSVTESVADLQRSLGRGDGARLTEYLESVRDVERRIQRAEADSATELPVVERPAGSIPTSFEEYAKLMFDLQVLAYQSDVTRIIHLHDRQGAQRPHLSGDRRARSASPAVAPPERSRETREADQGEHVPRVAARLLPGKAAGDARRRRHAARSAHAHLRQRHEQQQPARAAQAADPPARRRGRADQGRPARAFCRRHAADESLPHRAATSWAYRSNRSATATARCANYRKCRSDCCDS